MWRAGRQLILIGHAGHPEVEGTIGQIRGPVLLVQTVADVARSISIRTTPVAYVTQTTLSVDDTRAIIEALRGALHRCRGPGHDDICYATQNRQSAVRELAKVADVMLVVGATNSSNSNRLREIGVEIGVPSYLIADGSEVRAGWVRRTRESSASPRARRRPRSWSQDVIEALRALGPIELSMLPGIAENVEFRLPVELLRAQLGRTALPDLYATPQRKLALGIPSAAEGPHRRLRRAPATGAAASAIRSC